MLRQPYAKVHSREERILWVPCDREGNLWVTLGRSFQEVIASDKDEWNLLLLRGITQLVNADVEGFFMEMSRYSRFIHDRSYEIPRGLIELNMRDPSEVRYLSKMIFDELLCSGPSARRSSDQIAAFAYLVVRLIQRQQSSPCEINQQPEALSFTKVFVSMCLDKVKPLQGHSKEETGGLEAEDVNIETKQIRVRALVSMTLIGHMCLWKLVDPPMLHAVFQDLDKCDKADALPSETMIECMCELLAISGFVVERMVGGEMVLASVLSRLLDLKNRESGFYCMQIQVLMQTMLDGHTAARKVRDIVESSNFSKVFDMVDAMSLASSCGVSFWWNQMVKLRFGSRIQEERMRIEEQREANLTDFDESFDSDSDQRYDPETDLAQREMYRNMGGLDMYGQGG